MVFEIHFQIGFDDDIFFCKNQNSKMIIFQKKKKITSNSQCKSTFFFDFFSFCKFWNDNFVNKKSEKWYFFFCDIFFLKKKFQKTLPREHFTEKKYHLRNEKYHFGTFLKTSLFGPYWEKKGNIKHWSNNKRGRH